MNYCAILNGTSEVMWSYTLQNIKEFVDIYAYKGKWRIYELVHIP